VSGAGCRSLRRAPSRSSVARARNARAVIDEESPCQDEPLAP
jgi:hypothetical protein